MKPAFSALFLSMTAAAAVSPTRELLGKLALRFEAQSHGDTLFRARGPNFELSLAPTRHTIEWKDPTGSTLFYATNLGERW